MKEKKRRIIKRIISMFLTMMLLFNIVIFAGNGLIPDAKPTLGGDDGGMKGRVDTILSTIQYVGYAFAVGLLIWLGIRYTMAPANERADLKNGSIKYVVGAIIVFAAATAFPALYEGMEKWTEAGS